MQAEAWMQARGWSPFPFQQAVWQAVAAGESGLLHAGTGSGKTLAVALAALQSLPPGPLALLWITPMRALAHDSRLALAEALPGWRVALRSGDTSSSERAAQQKKPPDALVTTPESLSLLLAQADAAARLGRVRLVVVDEWHELLGSKRGVQLQLALARLRRWNPGLITWGLSATLGNPEQALQQLAPGATRLVRGQEKPPPELDSLIPPRIERFPWAGHLGLSLLPQVVERLEAAASTLVFTNTRSQSERWFQALLAARPDWAGLIALHHGSLDADARRWVEGAMKAGQLKAVVCTASLDLGVDFLPVEQVLQIGSVKGLARLLQRAGRSGHQPGRRSRITLVPTHSLELLEASALRQLLQTGQVEPRQPPQAPLDVLVQHLVTVALGGGFVPEQLLPELRSAPAYASLSDAAWAWALAFVRHGGHSLRAYPDFQRVQPDEEGVWRVPDARLARRHRSNIGTIVSDASMTVQFLQGARIATVEEGFIARLHAGDVFLLGGRLLELVRVDGMTAYVRLAKSGRPRVPRWAGGQLPISELLGSALLQRLQAHDEDAEQDPELRALRPLLDLQAKWSALPAPDCLLAETWRSAEGHHLFLYPFAGRSVHLALAALLAWRVARTQPVSFTLAVNDHGLELLSAEAQDWAALLPTLLQPGEQLAQELLDSLNASELAKRRFREIARIAGLVFQSHPGEQRSQRQLQASSSLYYEVFREHEPEHALLAQARQEVLTQELDLPGLQALLQRLSQQPLRVCALSRPTPLAFPLLVERLRERLSTETLAQRLARLVGELERAAGGTPPALDEVLAGLQFSAPEPAAARKKTARARRR